jgi:hypothetical protein
MASSSGRSGFAGLVIGPTLVLGGIVALWQNETRFDYAAEAANAQVITSVDEYVGDTVAYSGDFDTTIVLGGDYVELFHGYIQVTREAQIHAWEEDRRDDGIEWERVWQSRLEANARNRGVAQTLHDETFMPNRYQIGELGVDTRQLRFADRMVRIPPRVLQLSADGVRRGLEADGDFLYRRVGAARPGIGDERVGYRGRLAAPTMTYFGMHRGERAIPYREHVSTSGFSGVVNSLIGNDGMLYHVVAGDRQEALATLESDLAQTKWTFRVVGTLAIVVGFQVFFSVFTSILYGIPLLGRMVESGVWLVSLALGLPIALAILLAGVVASNPLTVALPLALGVGGFVWLRRRQRSGARHAGRMLEERLAEPASEMTVAAVDRTAADSVPVTVETVSATRRVRLERTFLNLAHVARVGGQFDKREKRFLVRWGRKQGIPDARMKELFSEAKNGGEIAMPWKRSELELLVCMALVDGALSSEEWELLKRCAEGVGMTVAQLKSVVREAQTGRLAPV